jgi:hypothetical protein
MVTLGGKDNCLEPGNRISTLMSSALDLWASKSIGNIFLLWVVHMCDMVSLGGKDNGLEPENHCVYRRTDDPIPVYPPQLRCGGYNYIYRNVGNLLQLTVADPEKGERGAVNQQNCQPFSCIYYHNLVLFCRKGWGGVGFWALLLNLPLIQ